MPQAKMRSDKKDRLIALQLASTTVYDTPQETVARAAAYYKFYKYGEIIPRPSLTKPRKASKR
jgi:hypothetical protein